MKGYSFIENMKNPATVSHDMLIFAPRQYIEHASVTLHTQWGFDETSRITTVNAFCRAWVSESGQRSGI